MDLYPSHWFPLISPLIRPGLFLRGKGKSVTEKGCPRWPVITRWWLNQPSWKILLTIHFGSRRPSVRNNVSNKQAYALFFQNAFTSWVHRASFLKLCLDQRLLPVMFWVQLRELLFLQKVFYLSNSWNVRGCAVRTHKEMTLCTWWIWNAYMYMVHACCMWGEGGWGRKTLSLMFYQNGNMLISLCQYLKVNEQRSWMKLNSVPLLLRTILCYPKMGSSSPIFRGEK